MKPGDVPKLRPALVLAMLPGPFRDVLICGISTQLRDIQPDWDERIGSADADYLASGLHRLSAIRLSYLYAAECHEISGPIGRINRERLLRLRQRLIDLLAR